LNQITIIIYGLFFDEITRFLKNQIIMKAYLFVILAAGSIILNSCDYDSYPYYYTGPSNQAETFAVKGTVTDADSLWPIDKLMVLMKPISVTDTFVCYTDSTGRFNFNYGKKYGNSATFSFRDTSGTYEDYDTVLYFSGRDYGAGIREFFVNL